MICLRCVIVVKSILEDLNIPYHNVSIGSIELIDQLKDDSLDKLQSKLLECELSLIKSRKSVMAEDIKTLIRVRLRSPDSTFDFRFSHFLTSAMHYDYTYLANIFSETYGTTIEKFYIEERVRRVKELIISGELTITEISYQLNFSSVPHLCSQFKKIAGMTTAEFKLQLKSKPVTKPERLKKFS